MWSKYTKLVNNSHNYYLKIKKKSYGRVWPIWVGIILSEQRKTNANLTFTHTSSLIRQRWAPLSPGSSFLFSLLQFSFITFQARILQVNHFHRDVFLCFFIFKLFISFSLLSSFDFEVKWEQKYQKVLWYLGKSTLLFFQNLVFLSYTTLLIVII